MINMWQKMEKKAYIWSAWTGTLLASHERIHFSQASASKISVGLQYHLNTKFQQTKDHTQEQQQLQVQSTGKACLKDTPK